ncbi:hypothetical protein ABH944_004893 [Caballeronia udeis]|uniref:Uncharacterized protein n=1 Tax=Caballeronia udeis TaxID=1232866 RepID=A0ABW8MLQ5_9BURK
MLNSVSTIALAETRQGEAGGSTAIHAPNPKRSVR